MKVRTRFAPSPTGFMHVGSLRTGLFCYLLARHFDGDFILRIEDTDQKREVEGSIGHILKTFKILGLNYDEGPDIGGPYGPYQQSQRLDIYREWAIKLLEQGRAYPDTTSPEELEHLRDRAKALKKPFLFREHRPEISKDWDGKTPLRFLSQPKSYSWDDAVMGKMHSGEEVIDDFIILKADGFPTYNFAHIIDDKLMEITHVIRAQEFLASVPKFLNLYEALGFDVPVLATVPPILGPDGKKKLSKRDGAKDILDYVRDGYIKEGLINFMASLGWNDGTEQEVFSLDELIDKFSLDHIQRSGANFDERRLLWMDGAHIRQLDLEDLSNRAEEFWPKSADKADKDYKLSVLRLVQERLKYLSELPALSDFFFQDLPYNPDLIDTNKQLKKYSREDLIKWLKEVVNSLKASDFSVADLESRLNDLMSQLVLKPGELFSLVRIATTQSPASPGLFDTLNILGKELSLKRIEEEIRLLNEN